MQTLHPKVKVPAVVGAIITIGLAVLSAVGANVPDAAAVCTGAVTAINTVAGYLTYSE